MQVLIARETARQLSMGDNISEPTNLPDFNVGEDIPKDLGEKYGQACFEADGFAQVRRSDVIPIAFLCLCCVSFRKLGLVTHPSARSVTWAFASTRARR